MTALFACAFTGFGPTRLDPTLGPPVLHQVQGRRPAELRVRIRQQAPRRPGVYGMVSSAGELIYVGKAKSLRARLLSYFRPKRDPKAGRILGCTRRIVWEHSPSEFAALLRELELIRRWQPHFNVQGQPRRRQPVYVCLGRRPAPYLFLTRRPPAGVSATFGPLFGRRRVGEAVRRLNDLFQLRDCPRAQQMIFAGQGDLFPVARTAGCLRYEIGSCLGPCAAACTRSAYLEQAQAARAFLEGADPTVLQMLERDLAAASTALQFERAAALYDKLQTLRWLNRKLERLRDVRDRHSIIYPVPGYDGRELWYLIHRGRVAAVLSAPHDPVSRERAAEAIDAVFFERTSWHLPAEQIDGVLLVATWFRRHPDQRQLTIAPADAVCLRALGVRR